MQLYVKLKARLAIRLVNLLIIILISM